MTLNKEGASMDHGAFARLFRSVRVLGPTAARQRGFVAFRGEAIQFDSSLEHAFLRRVADDPTTIAIVSQPCRIPWLDIDGRCRSYVPDFAILSQPMAGECEAWIVELKMAHMVRRLNERDRRKYVAMRCWAHDGGARIAIVTSEEIDKGLDKIAFFWAGHLSHLERKSRWIDNRKSLKINNIIYSSAREIQLATTERRLATVNPSNANGKIELSPTPQGFDTLSLLRHSAKLTEELLKIAGRCHMRRNSP